MLPVRENLAKRRISGSSQCPTCGQQSESVEHALLLCSWTRPLWYGLQLQYTPVPTNVSSFAHWLSNRFEDILQNPDFSTFGLITLSCALWCIWKDRNLKVFEDKEPNPMATPVHTNIIVSNYYKFALTKEHRKSNLVQTANNFCYQWRPPIKGWVKINLNSSFLSHKKIGVSGVVMRDEKGALLTGLTRQHTASNPFMAEMLAIRDGLSLAVSLGVELVVLESDNLEAVKACRKEVTKGETRAILEDVWLLQQNFEKCGFTWTNRKGNQVAHTIAALARDNLLPQNWTYNIPDSVKQLIDKDRRGL